MTNVSFTYSVKVDFNESEGKRSINQTLSLLDIKDVLVEVLFVGEKKIKSLNQSFRNINRPTDVLSFPQTQVPDSKINILGSIVICPAIAKERSESLNELIKHGVLHLAGYDHETNEEEWNKKAKLINHNM